MNKPKFNLMDGFLVAILVAVIAAAAFLFLKPDAKPAEAEKTCTAEYVLEFTKVQKYVADEFEKAAANNEILTMGETERFDAAIKNIDIRPASRHLINEETEEVVIAEDPLLFDVILTLESEVTETDDDIKAANTTLKVGNTLAAKSKVAAGYGYITDLSLNNN